MRASPKLDTSKIRAVVGVIRRIVGQVTWKRVALDVEDFLGHPYTRQALQSHPAIKGAYLDRKRGAPADGRRPPSAAGRARVDRDRRQRERIAELEAALDGANERIALLLENGARHGVLKAMLEADLELLHRAGDGPRRGTNGRRAHGGRKAL